MVEAQARAELRQLTQELGMDGFDQEEEEGEEASEVNPRIQELRMILQNGSRTELKEDGLDPRQESTSPMKVLQDVHVEIGTQQPSTPMMHSYHPVSNSPLASCGGVQLQDTSNDVLVFFFCPRASEAEFVEDTLLKCEETLAQTTLILHVILNLSPIFWFLSEGTTQILVNSFISWF